MKLSAADRTLPMFPGEGLDAADYRRELEEIDKLEKRMKEVLEKWLRDEVAYEDVLAAAKRLNEAKRKKR